MTSSMTSLQPKLVVLLFEKFFSSLLARLHLGDVSPISPVEISLALLLYLLPQLLPLLMLPLLLQPLLLLLLQLDYVAR